MIEKNTLKPFHKTPAAEFLTPNNFLIIVLIIAGLWNICDLTRDLFKNIQNRKNDPYQFAGVKFSGLGDILKNVEFIGYYTDGDITNGDIIADFSQAQLMLAPAVLDLNNTDHEYILFNCSRPEIGLKKIKDIGATPLKMNQLGIILARKPLSPST